MEIRQCLSKKGSSRVKPYEKPTNEQTDENSTHKEASYELVPNGEQGSNHEEVIISCICNGNITEETEGQNRDEAIYCEGSGYIVSVLTYQISGFPGFLLRINHLCMFIIHI